MLRVLSFTRVCVCVCVCAQSCLILCNPKDCITPGFPMLHHLPEFAQTHVHWVSDDIQQSHLLSPPSPALNLSQHQGLFQAGRKSNGKLGSRWWSREKLKGDNSEQRGVHSIGTSGLSPAGATVPVNQLQPFPRVMQFKSHIPREESPIDLTQVACPSLGH